MGGSLTTTSPSSGCGGSKTGTYWVAGTASPPSPEALAPLAGAASGATSTAAEALVANLYTTTTKKANSGIRMSSVGGVIASPSQNVPNGQRRAETETVMS